MVSLIPEAIFALCAGCATLAPLSGGLSMFTRPNKDCNKVFFALVNISYWGLFMIDILFLLI